MSYNDRGRHLIVWIQSTIVFGFMFGQCGVWRIWCLHLRRRTTFTTIPHSRPVNFSDDSVKLSTVNILFENLWIYRNLFLVVLFFISTSTKFSLTYSLVYEEILTIEKWEKNVFQKMYGKFWSFSPGQWCISWRMLKVVLLKIRKEIIWVSI